MVMNYNKLPLGKKEYVPDDRTLRLAAYIKPEIRAPAVFDFDKGRRPLPIRNWGNLKWGDCVIAGEANHTLRLERVEQRGTILLTDRDAVRRYQALTGSVAPGDSRDVGLVVLDAMKDWRNNGWPVDTPAGVRTYRISAYGELEPNDPKQMRKGIFALHGVHIGFWLPLAAQQMTESGLWDYQNETGPDWKPGGWGGHLVYSKAYNEETYEILTWGTRVRVTNSFMARYADEAWAVVDSLDDWRTTQSLDVPALIQRLLDVTAKVNVE